jgi:hypothetical protein
MLLVAVALLPFAAPVHAAKTLRLEIVHVVQNCHAWQRDSKSLGPRTTVTVKRGARLVIRANCPMDFDFAQVAGPRLRLGDPRTYAGTQRVLTFQKAGRYRLTATNVQTPEERGLETLGPPNVLVLTVVVR